MSELEEYEQWARAQSLEQLEREVESSSSSVAKWRARAEDAERELELERNKWRIAKRELDQRNRRCACDALEHVCEKGMRRCDACGGKR